MIRPVAVPESGIIGHDKVIAIGKVAWKRLEHSRGRGQSVEQEERWRTLRAGFPEKDGK